MPPCFAHVSISHMRFLCRFCIGAHAIPLRVLQGSGGTPGSGEGFGATSPVGDNTPRSGEGEGFGATSPVGDGTPRSGEGEGFGTTSPVGDGTPRSGEGEGFGTTSPVGDATPRSGEGEGFGTTSPVGDATPGSGEGFGTTSPRWRASPRLVSIAYRRGRAVQASTRARGLARVWRAHAHDHAHDLAYDLAGRRRYAPFGRDRAV